MHNFSQTHFRLRAAVHKLLKSVTIWPSRRQRETVTFRWTTAKVCTLQPGWSSSWNVETRPGIKLSRHGYPVKTLDEGAGSRSPRRNCVVWSEKYRMGPLKYRFSGTDPCTISDTPLGIQTHRFIRSLFQLRR